MVDPIVPPVTPAAPAAPAVPQAPAAAVPAEPVKPVDPPKANPWDDPAAAKTEIERLRKENGSDRVNAKAQAATDARNEFAQTIGKALGLIKDNEPADPAKLTEQLTASSAEARAARVELAVFRAAGSIADPVALLDSKTFLASVKDIDPADAAALQAAIASAVESNPRLGSATPSRLPAPNPAQGSSASGPVAPSQLSKEDVSRMYAQKDYDGIAKAQAEGRLSKLMGA